MKNNFQWHRGGSSRGEAGYFISFDYDAELVEQLKKTVPSFLREWNPETKQWWISELCEKAINDLFPGFLEAVVAQKKLF